MIYRFTGILLLVTLLAACKHKAEETTESEKTTTVITITEPVSKGFVDFIKLNGNTQFQKKTVIRANITGYITAMPRRQGDHIGTGQFFCSIKTKEQDALKNIDIREPSLRQFQAPINVTSGSSGIITAVNYNKGDYVSEGDVLATVTDPSSLVLAVNVPYEFHNDVYRGKPCTVTFPDGKMIQSFIQEELPYIDSASQTQTYLIRFPGNTSLPENMNLTVQIPVRQTSGSIALPMQAIQADETQESFWVMKLINDSLAVKVPVTVGSQHDEMQEILSGIKLNDRVVLKGAYGLADSSSVRIEAPMQKLKN